MKTLTLALALIMACGAASAFVERLNPYGSAIPCTQFRAFVIEYNSGKFSAQQLSQKLQALYEITWTPHDSADNQWLLNHLASIDFNTGNATVDTALEQLARDRVGMRLEGMCAMAEQGEPALDTPVKYRNMMGIPAP